MSSVPSNRHRLNTKQRKGAQRLGVQLFVFLLWRGGSNVLRHPGGSKGQTEQGLLTTPTNSIEVAGPLYPSIGQRPMPTLVRALGLHWFGPRARIGLGPGPALVWSLVPHWFGPRARIGLDPEPAWVALVRPFWALGPQKDPKTKKSRKQKKRESQKMVAEKALEGFLVSTWTRNAARSD